MLAFLGQSHFVDEHMRLLHLQMKRVKHFYFLPPSPIGETNFLINTVLLIPIFIFYIQKAKTTDFKLYSTQDHRNNKKD